MQLHIQLDTIGISSLISFDISDTPVKLSVLFITLSWAGSQICYK